jgi:hypothetical protein
MVDAYQLSIPHSTSNWIKFVYMVVFIFEISSNQKNDKLSNNSPQVQNHEMLLFVENVGQTKNYVPRIRPWNM